ncbi:MAG: hypothetical protein IKC08_06665, partial [Lentisphaeria bacterium]|nr:hypothetical protein [Lentisphaeria bacterium]
AIVCITIILTGCQDPWITDTKRNAIEQYMLATDHKRFLIGTPPLPIPIPDTTLSVVVPEIAVFKRIHRIAYGRMSFTVFNAKTLEPLKVIPYINSSAQYNNFAILLIPFSLNDMDMKDTVSGEFSIGLD